MQMNSLIMRLTHSRFKQPVLMVHLQLNYTIFDVWLAVSIFMMRQLLYWRATQAPGACPALPFGFLILNSWQNPEFDGYT